MPKRTFIPNLLRYRRKHGFLKRLKDSPHIIRAQYNRENQKRKYPLLGPNSNFCKRKPRIDWMSSWP